MKIEISQTSALGIIMRSIELSVVIWQLNLSNDKMILLIRAPMN